MKRILALLLCFVMVFSLVAVAEETATNETESTVTAKTTEFSDVPANSPYKEAISTLSLVMQVRIHSDRKQASQEQNFVLSLQDSRIWVT